MANMQICANGHYYDGNRYTECPYCKPNQQPAGPGVTVPAGSGGSGGVPCKTVPSGYTPINTGSGDGGEGKTVAMDVVPTPTNVRPVVGWLVCVKGPDMGRDYRLHTSYNYVGRGGEMDVAIKNDDTISRERHFSVMYDKKHDSFLAFMGNGKEIVYLNDRPLSPAGTPLVNGDMLEVGKTTLIFVSFDHKWEAQE